LPPSEAAVWQTLTAEWKHADDIVRESQLPTHEALAALTMLELKGLAERGEGNHFRRPLRWR